MRLAILILALAAIAGAQTTITVSWGAPTSGLPPTNYNVKRATTSGAEVTVGTVAAPAVQFVDTIPNGLVVGTKYYYVVTSVVMSGGNVQAESGPSVELGVTFQLPNAPTGTGAVVR